MDVSLVFHRLFRVEIRRLLFVIGLLVAVVIVSQCFSFPNGKTLYVSVVEKDSNSMTIVNASNSKSNHSIRPTDIHTVQVLAYDSEDDVEFENEADHEDGDGDGESASEIENNSSKKAVFENGANSDSVSSLSPLAQSKTIDESNDKHSDPEEAFPEGIRNSSVAGFERHVKQAQKNHGKFEPKAWMEGPTTLSQMHSLLLRSSVKPRRSSARDRELLSAKLEIEKAPVITSTRELSALVFLNVSKFQRSYELMEQVLKVYVYKEGDKPVFHQPYMRGIYASEGWFMKLMEANKRFVVRDPKKAHLFYLPFSSKVLRFTLYERKSMDKKNLEKYLKRYVDSIARKYRFWNRTDGADHFLVACHDWASYITRKTMKNCIRSLCNANVAKDFKIGKDTGFPVTYVRSAADPLENLGGKPASQRPVLAFFAGGLHGYLRPILLQYWENKEPDMKIFGPMPRDIQGKRVYREYMKTSKYCICARGYEVHTPRVVESIFYECVPVIISDNYVPPFFEVLNWEAFSVFVMEKDVPNLRNILLSIPKERYELLQLGVKKVQKHFLWHKNPVKYDLFHMTLHSVWNNRLLQVKTR